MSQYQRNILIIGKNGAGKTSITNAILNKDDPSPVDSFLQANARSTKQRFFRELKEQLEVKIQHISVNSNQTEVKDVEAIMKDFKFLNLVLFVIKLEPMDDLLCKQLEKVITCLGPEASPITAIIFTWFDSFDSRAKVQIEQELNAHVEWLYGFAKKGVHMISLPQLNYIEESLHPFLSEKSKRSKKTLQKLCDQAEKKVYCGIPVDIPRGTQLDVEGPKKILIFGKTGVGKSTVANAILGSNQLPVGTPIESTTREAGRYKCSEFESICGAVYKIGIIDTVGVADRRSNKSFSKRVQSAIKEIQSVNLILFVMKMERFTPQERDSFEEVISILQNSVKLDTSTVTAFVVTCCEQKSDENRDATKLELKEFAKNVVRFAGKGIYLVGLPPSEQIPLPLKDYYEKIRRTDTNTLQTLVRESQLEILIHESEGIKPRQTQRGTLNDFFFCS